MKICHIISLNNICRWLLVDYYKPYKLICNSMTLTSINSHSVTQSLFTPSLTHSLVSSFNFNSKQRNSVKRQSMELFKGQPRLPKFAVPKRYDIHLKPDLTTCKFSGSVSIDVNIVDDTRFIVLNAAELSVDTSSVSFSHPLPDSSKSKQKQVFFPKL